MTTPIENRTQEPIETVLGDVTRQQDNYSIFPEGRMASSLICSPSGQSHATLWEALHDFGPSSCEGDDMDSGVL